MRGIFILTILGVGACATPARHPQTVASVDLERYAGEWHEVARFVNDFEDAWGQRCVNVNATYTLQSDGGFRIRNTCNDALKEGREEVSEGWGRAADGSGSKLRVTFFWPFSADYWIIGLDQDYHWAVVGSPSRRYLWILSRTPTLSADDYTYAEHVAAAQGFDVTKLVKTPPQT